MFNNTFTYYKKVFTSLIKRYLNLITKIGYNKYIFYYKCTNT